MDVAISVIVLLKDMLVHYTWSFNLYPPRR
jgi:hypothetical protein